MSKYLDLTGLSYYHGKIQGEVNQLEHKVTDIDTTLSAIFGVESLVTSWESGALNSTTGVDLADASCMRSNFIPVTPGNVYEYWGSTGSAARAILVGYSSNSDSTKTEIVKGVAGQSGSVLQRFIPGSTTNYIRISYQIGYTGDYGVWTEPKEKEDYLLGFFDRDSDFKTYNGIKIFDIYANTNVDTTVRLKIFGLGVTSNHAFVAICKDSGTYPSNCVARYYVPLTDISGLSGKQTITVPEYNSSGANFTMVVDIDDLKTKAHVDQNGLFLNSEYINRKALARKDDILKMGVFSQDSIMSGYLSKDIIIYDISASNFVDSLNYKIGLLYCAKYGTDKVLIAITKNCENYEGDSSKLVARLYDDILNIPSGINTLTIPHFGTNTIDYYIKIDCDKLKSLSFDNNSNIFFSKSHIDANIRNENSEYGLYKYIAGIKSVPEKYLKIFKCIKDVQFFVSGIYAHHEYVMCMFGYSTQYNRLYLRIYDKTDNAVDCLAYKDYNSMPTSGIETVVFENYSGVRGGQSYQYILVIDWGEYESEYFFDANNDGVPISVNLVPINANIFRGNDTPLEDVIGLGKILTGTFTLTSQVYLKDGQILRGDSCVVNCGDGGRILMLPGSEIHGIRFVGNWNIARTDGDGVSVTQYGYVPLISTNDLTNEDSDALFGEGKTESDALIYIQNNLSYNVIIDGCRFEKFDKIAIRVGAERHKSSNNPIICNNYFSDCRCALAVFGEFHRIYANEYFRCVIGVYLKGANVNQFGEIYKCCDCGIFYPTNPGAHNEITSIQIAHCGICGFYIKELPLEMGSQLTGCHLADAAIIGENVNCLLITGGRLDTFFRYLQGGHNSIICSNIGTSYLYGNPLYSVPADTQIAMNRGLSTTTDAQANNQS